MEQKKVDKKFIYQMIGIYDNIFSIYQKLMINKFEENKELYNKNKETLLDLIDYSEDIFNAKNLSYDEICDCMEYIDNKTKFNSNIENLDIILKYESKDDLAARRLFFRFEEEAVKNKKFMENVASKIYDFSDDITQKEKNELTKKAMIMFNFKEYLKDDNISLFVFNLNKKTPTTNEDIQKKLIETKYETLFLFPKVEKNFFNPQTKDDKFYLSSKLYADVAGLTNMEYLTNKVNLCIDDATMAIDYILDIDNEKISKLNKFASVFINETYLKSCLSQLDNNILEQMNYDFHQIIESDDYLNKHKKNEFIISSIITTFYLSGKDKENIKTLTFKPIR